MHNGWVFHMQDTVCPPAFHMRRLRGALHRCRRPRGGRPGRPFRAVVLAAAFGAVRQGEPAARQRRHGPYLLSASKAFQLAFTLSTNAVLYHDSRKATLDPATPLVVRHGVHGAKPVDPRQLALLVGLALDCGGRRGELGLGEDAFKALERRTHKVGSTAPVILLSMYAGSC